MNIFGKTMKNFCAILGVWKIIKKSLKSIYLHGSSLQKNMVFYKILLQYHTYKIKKTVFKNLLNWLSYRAFTVRVQIQHKVKGAQLSSAVSWHRTQKNNKWWLRDIFQVCIKIFAFVGIHSPLAPKFRHFPPYLAMANIF